MKKTALFAAVFLSLGASLAQAGNVGVDIGVHIGNQPPVVAVPGPPPPVVIEEPPEFIYPAELGFGVAIGSPYDLFYISSSYFLFRGNVWYRAPYYNGPWVVTKYKSLPPGLRRHKLGRIHEYREREYRAYRGDRDHYRGRYYRPDKHEMKERRKEEKREMKEERKEQRREEKGEGRGRGHGRD
ncbi:MAG TPA: hypothetical protein VK187_03255 [Geobacteraceae bacterium]|nr:hypothetical protein [Geobacteraceae bacterium]